MPIWIGGESHAALRRAARLGNGWHSAGTSLAELPEKISVIREELAAVGRSEADFVLSTDIRQGFAMLLLNSRFY